MHLNLKHLDLYDKGKFVVIIFYATNTHLYHIQTFNFWNVTVAFLKAFCISMPYIQTLWWFGVST